MRHVNLFGYSGAKRKGSVSFVEIIGSFYFFFKNKAYVHLELPLMVKSIIKGRIMHSIFSVPLE